MQVVNLDYDKLALADLGIVLAKDDLSYIRNVTGELKRAHDHQVKWRSKFIMENGILSDQKFPTPASKWFQCIREELVFWEELVRTGIKYSRANINKKKLELKIKQLGNSEMETLDKELLLLDITEKEFEMINAKRDAKERVREIRHWESIKDKLLKENPKLDINNQENHEEETWVAKWKTELQIPKGLVSPTMYKDCLANLQTWEKNKKKDGVKEIGS